MVIFLKMTPHLLVYFFAMLTVPTIFDWRHHCYRIICEKKKCYGRFCSIQIANIYKSVFLRRMYYILLKNVDREFEIRYWIILFYGPLFGATEQSTCLFPGCTPLLPNSYGPQKVGNEITYWLLYLFVLAFMFGGKPSAKAERCATCLHNYSEISFQRCNMTNG